MHCLFYKIACYRLAIVYMPALYSDYPTYELTEQFVQISVKKMENPTNKQPSYFGLFGETMHPSHLD